MIGYIQLMFIILLSVLLLCLAIFFVTATIMSIRKLRDDYRQTRHRQLAENMAEIDRLNLQNEKDIRERIANDFDRMSGERNPADPEGSAQYSRWAMNAADRIRHPERYSGVSSAR